MSSNFKQVVIIFRMVLLKRLTLSDERNNFEAAHDRGKSCLNVGVVSGVLVHKT